MHFPTSIIMLLIMVSTQCFHLNGASSAQISMISHLDYLGNSTTSIMMAHSTHKVVWRRRQHKYSKIMGRIIGGRVAKAHEFPYVAALHIYDSKKDMFFCGGSLIRTIWVLTAAHCPHGAYFINVFLGANDIQAQEPNRITYTTKSWIIHEKYDPEGLDYDVALLKLPEEVRLNAFIKLIPLETKDANFTNQEGQCAGWGKTNYAEISSVLRCVDVIVISDEECRSYEEYEDLITHRQICTSGEGVLGSCQGDSGGPLALNDKLVGVVSFGIDDCIAEYPSIYTKVEAFLPWIMKHAVDPPKKNPPKQAARDLSSKGVIMTSSDAFMCRSTAVLVVFVKCLLKIAY